MKNALKILLLLLTAFLVFSLAACGDEPEDDKVRVMVAVGEGFTVTGDNPVDVAKGGTATFTVEISEGYVFESVSVGEFDILTGTLTLTNVTERTNITFTVKKVTYDTSAVFSYFFHGEKADTTSIRSAPEVQAGTLVKVTAGETSKIFVGWSFGASTKLGGIIISSEKEFEFYISGDYAANGAIHLYANYLETNVLIYDANGGTINTGTKNTAQNEYYTVSVDGTKLRYTMLQEYYDYAGCAATFWDDGTFVREGYVLREYNTKPDGTGEGYSLGSKFYTGTDTEYPVLYCIWDKATPVSDFTTGNEIILKPAKVIAPDWDEQGVKIVSYNGNAEHVVIPETVNGVPVIAIAKDAFVNKNIKTLTLPRTLLKIEDGAFVGCSSLETLYFPNSIYFLSDEIFDEATYTSFKKLIVNATMAPRNGEAFPVKLCKVLRNPDAKKIIVISGSSSYQSLGSDYFEALLDKEYKVINFGTTRPRLGAIYLEALSHYTDSDDIFVYAPENSAYMYGETLLWWRMVREMEGMNNLFRYLDVSNYEGYFDAFRDLNQSLGEPGKMGYYAAERRYEDICKSAASCDENGDYQHKNRGQYVNDTKYTDSYYITLNNRVKSKDEALWSDEAAQERDKDYTDLTNPTWASIDEPWRVAQLNQAINKAKATGAKVYFGYAPSDADSLVDAAKNKDWLAAFDTLIDNLYDFDGRLGGAADYVYNHKYFYDCAFHTNDYGRAWRTYDLYLDICEKLGKSETYGFKEKGTFFDGCLFEQSTDNKPLHGVDYLQ